MFKSVAFIAEVNGKVRVVLFGSLEPLHIIAIMIFCLKIVEKFPED